MTDLTRLSTARRLGSAGREIRQRAHLSLRDLAAAIGVDSATLWRWETGHVRPRAAAALRWVETLEAIAKTLDPGAVL